MDDTPSRLELGLAAQDNLIGSTDGFMPRREGEALAAALFGLRLPREMPAVEIGSYQGLSTIYLGVAAKMSGRTLITLDHHRGSEENQAGWAYHNPNLVDEVSNKMDTLYLLRRTLDLAGLESSVVTVVADSSVFAKVFGTEIGFLFIDGGHATGVAHADYDSWAPKLAKGAILAIHDVFENAHEGGRPPYELYLRSLGDDFVELHSEGSLKIMQRAPGSLHQ